MRRSMIQLLIVLAFAVLTGHMARQAFGPRPARQEAIIGDREVIRAEEPRGRHFYARRTLHLAEKPRSGWIHLLGWDSVELYVNGVSAGAASDDRVSVSLAVDLSPYLQEGRNVLAVVSRSRSLDHLPELAVEGRIVTGEGSLPIAADSEWRYSGLFNRGGHFWHAVDYNDEHWPAAVVASSRFRTPLSAPAPVQVEPNRGLWITPDQANARRAVFDHAFQLEALPRSAWLVLQTNSAMTLAVNNVVVDQDTLTLATGEQASAEIRSGYNVSRLIREGPNRLTLRVDGGVAAPRAALELRLIDARERSISITSGADWRWRPDNGGGWIVGSETDEWRDCEIVSNVREAAPAEQRVRPVREPDYLADYHQYLWREWLGGPWPLATAVLAVVAFLLTRVVNWLLAPGVSDESSKPLHLADLALLPTITLFGFAILASYDKRVLDQDVYRAEVVIGGLMLVALQWIAMLVLLGFRGRPVRRLAPPVRGHAAWAWCGVVLLIVAGGYLRVRDCTARPLISDEVSMHDAVVGFWEHGFPALIISDNMPPVFASTSELACMGPVLVSMFSDNDRVIVRAPPVFFSILTIPLIFIAGRYFFSASVGLAAATIYTFSITCVGTAVFGRYPAQLQFFTLLTTYFFCRGIEPRDRVSGGFVWAACLSFIAMFLTWEGSALFAPALALAAAVCYRDRLPAIFGSGAVWAGIVLVAVVVLVQSSHRAFEQTSRPLYGSGAHTVALAPMVSYPGYEPGYYLLTSSWSPNLLLPLIGVLLGAMLAIQGRHSRSARLLLLVYLLTALAMSTLLPVRAGRYGYFLTTLPILLASAGVVETARRLTRASLVSQRPAALLYARVISALMIASYAAASCGLLINPSELRSWGSSGHGLAAISSPWQEDLLKEMRERVGPGDVVITNAPHVVEHYLGRPTDYWVQTTMHLQALLDDESPLPRHRFRGVPMLRDVDHLREVFSRHDRVWFVTYPSFNRMTNTDQAVDFMRRNMDVVYEDFSTYILLKGDSHRIVKQKRQDEKALSDGSHPM